jgi:hypothetical protein
MVVTLQDSAVEFPRRSPGRTWPPCGAVTNHPDWQCGWSFPAAGVVRRRVCPASVSQPATASWLWSCEAPTSLPPGSEGIGCGRCCGGTSPSLRVLSLSAHRYQLDHGSRFGECAVCGCHRVLTVSARKLSAIMFSSSPTGQLGAIPVALYRTVNSANWYEPGTVTTPCGWRQGPA